jgi:predicted lipoprotein with Yx(FWY)xxD motif
MKRAHLLLAGLLAAAGAFSAAAGAQTPQGSAHAAKAAKLQVRSTSLGKILVDTQGFTVYRFTKDRRNKDTCVSTSGCAEVWPPLTTSGRPIAGAGVKTSLLSTIKLSGGRKQVTYGGHPLYLYKPATERGETSYVGVTSFGGTWDAVNAAGGLVK